MTSIRARRLSVIAALAAGALLTLSACINITYALNVNPDASLSGKIQLSVTKQAASILGIATAEDLNSKLQSGQLSDQASSATFQSCLASEDDANLVLSCTVTNVQASDIDKSWSMTTDGQIATFHAQSDVSANASSAGLPGFSQGGYDFTLSFPGPISSISGTGAAKTGPNTMSVKGSLDKPLDITVVGALSSGGSSMTWIYVLLGVLAALAVGVLALVLRQGSRRPPAVETPAIAASSGPLPIEGSSDVAPITEEGETTT